MIPFINPAKSGAKLFVSSLIVLALAGCAQSGGPEFAAAGTTPPAVVVAEGDEPFDNTDVYKGNNGDVPVKAAMAVEGLYRTSLSYETRLAEKQNESLAPELKDKAQDETYAKAKDFIYQGSMTDEAVYEWLKTIEPAELPEAGTDKYTYEILVEKSKITVDKNTAVVSLEDSYSVKDKIPVKMAKETAKTLKLTKINGKWLVDVPGTIQGVKS